MIQLDTIELRRCTKCGEEKPATADCFHRHGSKLVRKCKVCKAKEVKEWAVANPERVRENNARSNASLKHKEWVAANANKVRGYQTKYYIEHKDEIKARMAAIRATPEGKKRGVDYYHTAKPKLDAYHREYRRTHPELHRRDSRRYHQEHSEDPTYRLTNAMKGRVRKVLHGKKAGRSWKILVGYTVDELRKHLESLLQPGMTWENYGGKDGWWIDHIRPVASFSYTTAEDPEFKECWSLANLQPLWAKDNISKSDKWEPLESLTTLCV